MSSRTRVQSPSVVYYGHGTPAVPVGTMPREIFTEFTHPGSCNCVHHKGGLFSGSGTFPYDPSQALLQISNYVGYIRFSAIPSSFWADALALEWDKLPTSSQFSLLNTIAEIDDLIAIFTEKFWQSLTYGSFTWGVIPFVLDLKALLKAIKNIGTDISGFSYETSRLQDLNYSVVWGSSKETFNGQAEIHLTGSGDISFQDQASLLLDRIGLHPDFATAWDLVPLSFLLDYFIDVGSFLESFRQGGWVKAMLFSGWSTIKFTGQLSIEWFNPAYPDDKIDIGSSSVSCFTRQAISDVLIPPGIQITPLLPSIPSLLDVFNVLYVLVLQKKFKNI